MSETVLINVFEVAPEREDEFLRLWSEADRLLNERSGYKSTKLHRAVTPDARFRYINVAELRSVDSWRAAISSPEFAAIGAQMAQFQPNPALYAVAVHHEAGQVLA
jgi:heme-degrading monooxygenase HmoA